MWHPTRDELVAAALPAEPSDPGVQDHLSRCGSCRGEVEDLRAVVGRMRDGAAPLPPGPPDRVWHGVLDELGDELEPAAEAEVVGPDRRRRGLLLVAAAVLVAVVAVGSVLLGGREEPGTTAAFTLQPVAGADGASGAVRMRADRSMIVDVRVPGGLPPGQVLEAWTTDPVTGGFRPLGWLDAPSDGGQYEGRFALSPTAGTPTTVDVSVESLDGNPDHSGRSVVRGTG